MKSPLNILSLRTIGLLLSLPIADLYAQSSVNSLKYNKIVPKWQKLLLPDRLTHFTQYTGPSLSLDGNPKKFDGSENVGGQNSWHQVSLQYQINKETRFVFNPRFTLNYGPLKQGENQGELVNPVFGINTTWYKNGNFTFSGGLNSVAYVFDADDREDGLVFNPGGFQSLNYKINNKVDVGSWLWARYRYFQNNPDRARLPMFVAPYASYAVNDKLGFTAFYQYNGTVDEIDTVTVDPDDTLNILTSISVAKNLTVQPIITLYRETDMELASGNLNVWISGRFY